MTQTIAEKSTKEKSKENGRVLAKLQKSPLPLYRVDLTGIAPLTYIIIF
jgi:hypothetical protein